VNGLAEELQVAKLEEHLAAAAEIGRLAGLTEDDLAERMRRAHRDLEEK
jgi:hypothetical protein